MRTGIHPLQKNTSLIPRLWAYRRKRKHAETGKRSLEWANGPFFYVVRELEIILGHYVVTARLCTAFHHCNTSFARQNRLYASHPVAVTVQLRLARQRRVLRITKWCAGWGWARGIKINDSEHAEHSWWCFWCFDKDKKLFYTQMCYAIPGIIYYQIYDFSQNGGGFILIWGPGGIHSTHGGTSSFA